MEIDDLRCFLAVARHLSFRRGAKEVHLSPAAFSERIARLEGALGARLLERTTRRVSLTSAGERLVPAARRILADVADLPALARDDGRPAPCTLTLGTRHELGISWLQPAVQAMERQHPERTVHLRFSDSHALLDALEAGTLDAVITSFRLTRPGLDYVTLHEERYAFVASPTLLEGRPMDRPSDAAAHTLVDVHADLPLFRYWLDAYEGPEVWAFSQVRLLGTIEAVRARVRAGLGVAVLPRYYVEPDLTSGQLVSILPDVEPVRDWFRLVWRRGDAREPTLQAIAAELRELPLC